MGEVLLRSQSSNGVVSNQACVLIKLVKRVPLSLSQQSKAEQIHVIEKDCNCEKSEVRSYIFYRSKACPRTCSLCGSSLYYYCIEVHVEYTIDKEYLPTVISHSVAQYIFNLNQEEVSSDSMVYMSGSEKKIIRYSKMKGINYLDTI